MTHGTQDRHLHAIAFVLLLILFSSCATIIGGSKYYAAVTVKNHPNATISYKGFLEGRGFAMFKVKRSDANKFTIKIKEEGCSEQTASFTKRKFRGWAFAGTILGWTGIIDGIPLPWGILVDLSLGSVWKPDNTENGVKKVDFRHYEYSVDYSGCMLKDSTNK
jgi:hypothetical protein